MKNRERLPAYLALLANSFLWALAIPLAKLGFANGLTPVSFLFSRFLFAGIVSIPIIIILRNRTEARAAFSLPRLGKIVLLELLGTFLALWLLYEGVLRTSAVEATLISITYPILITLGGVLFFKEKEDRFEVTGLLLAIAGSVLVIIQPLLTDGFQWKSFFGNILILGQNVVIAAYYLLAKKTYSGLNKWAVSHIGFWVGAATFALIIFARGSTPATELTFLFTNMSWWPLLAVLYMATFGSILALTLYLFGQDKIEASEASLFTYLQPVFTLPIAVFFLGETIGWWEIAGASLILIGVCWSAFHHKLR